MKKIVRGPIAAAERTPIGRVQVLDEVDPAMVQLREQHPQGVCDVCHLMAAVI